MLDDSYEFLVSGTIPLVAAIVSTCLQVSTGSETTMFAASKVCLNAFTFHLGAKPSAMFYTLKKLI